MTQEEQIRLYRLMEKLNWFFHQEMHYLDRNIAEQTARECYPEIREFTYDILWNDLPKEVQEAADRSWESNKAKPAELNIPIQTLGWSYHSTPRQRQKSAKEVMELLEYCAKVNANLLLNIGPSPDGTILEENVQVLREVGQKLKEDGFPKLNTKDYMKYRNEAKQVHQKEKENQTAN